MALYEAEQEKKLQNLSAALPKRESAEQIAEEVPHVTLESEDVTARMPAKAKKPKPKPASATVHVDFSIHTGKVKPMHGMCNGPISYGADISDVFREIGVPIVRFDATDTAISRSAIDISRIFKNPDADPTDPESYDFTDTDKYVDAAMCSGAQVIYRLGESRDVFGTKSVPVMSDTDALSRVCVNIIRHYNDGWAGGRHYGIKYFEILNCPDDRAEMSERIELYRRLANAVKLHDEEIKVGGLSFERPSDAKEFLRAAKRGRIPVDFITLDFFSGDPISMRGDIEGVFAYAQNLGFEDIEIFVGKWSFIDESITDGSDVRSILASGVEKARKVKKEIFLSQRTVKGAAFAAATMLLLNQTEGVAGACFYDAEPNLSPFCALTDRFGEVEKPFYCFKAFGELYRAGRAVFSSVESPEDCAHSGIFASAAVSDLGEGYLMIASLGGCGVVDLRLEGFGENLYSADVYMLDGVKDMSFADSVPISGMKKRIVLNVSEYGAMLIKLH